MAAFWIKLYSLEDKEASQITLDLWRVWKMNASEIW
jgi:hypothetical protein